MFADMLLFCRLYYPLHNNLPKPFRFAVGERILAESAECLRAIVLANAADKASAARWEQWFGSRLQWVRLTELWARVCDGNLTRKTATDIGAAPVPGETQAVLQA